MTILLTIVILVGVVTIIYIVNFNNLQAYKIKINEAESIIDDLLRKKYDNLLLIKDVIVEETDVDAKVFDELKKFKTMNISSFDFERKLTEINNLIDKIKSDYENLNSDVRFNNYYTEIYECNEKLEATKSFYNKYIWVIRLTRHKKFFELYFKYKGVKYVAKSRNWLLYNKIKFRKHPFHFKYDRNKFKLTSLEDLETGE